MQTELSGGCTGGGASDKQVPRVQPESVSAAGRAASRGGPVKEQKLRGQQRSARWRQHEKGRKGPGPARGLPCGLEAVGQHGLC